MTKEEILQAFDDINFVYNDCTRYDTLKRMLEELTERKRGEWIAYNGDDPNWLRNDGSPVFMQCSECNTMVVNNFAFNWNFCPNCGARMDERREDEQIH